MFITMSLDLNTILKDWPHETAISRCAKSRGWTAGEIATRVDLGVVTNGSRRRPDGGVRTIVSRFWNSIRDGRPCCGERGDLRARAETMRRTPTGRYPILSSLFELFQIMILTA